MLIIPNRLENKRDSRPTAINLFILLNLRKSKCKHLNKQYCTLFLVCYSMSLMWWLFLEKHSTVHKADDILQLLFPSKQTKKKKEAKTNKKQTTWQPGRSSVNTLGIRRQVWTRPLHCQWEAGEWEDVLWKRGGRGEDEDQHASKSGC